MVTSVLVDPPATTPRVVLPPGACDAHCHIVGPERDFPFVAGRSAPEAPKEALFALHRQLGIERCVVVQSASHGFDNRGIEDTVRAGGGRYLGIAAVPVDVADAELARLAGTGIRGVRFNFMAHLARNATPEQVVDLSHRLAPLGLHLQVHFESSLVHVLAPLLRRSAVPVVIDHMGRVNAELGPDHADFAAVHQLMRDPLFMVKVSGIDRVCPEADYAPGVELARIMVQDYPDRCVWGTDWPHSNHHRVPDSGVLTDLLPSIAPDPRALQRLMVDNPMNFYRFDA